MSRTKKIAILAIIAMVLTLLPVSLFAATADSDRLSGADRIGTAIEVADAGWTTAGTVILAPADQANLVDALAAAPLAGQENAPILLTFKGGLSDDVKAKIVALGATKVYVVGAISDSVVAEVNALAGVTAEKLSGANRWATADAINAKLTAPAGSFVVGYNAIPDALSVASYAAAKKYAIVLTNADGTVNASKLVGAKTYLVGGTTVVKDYAGATRLGGADRFATNVEVLKGLSYDYARVYVANGLSMVDALSVAPLAAKYNAFVALASATNVAAASTLNADLTASSKVIAVGGLSAVSASVVGQVGVAQAGALAVQSVSAINAKQLQVTFNKAIDEATVVATDDTVVDGVFTIVPVGTATSAGTTNDFKAELSKDKRTLTITATNYFDGEYTFAITKDAIKTEANEKLGAYSTLLNIKDTNRPTITGVSYQDINNAIIAFSEPVQAPTTAGITFARADGVSIVAGTLVAGDITAGPKLNEWKVNLSNLTAPDKDKNINITIMGAKDAKGNVLTPNPTVVSVKLDTTSTSKPALDSIKVTGNTTFEIKFNTALTPNTIPTVAVTGATLDGTPAFEKDNNSILKVKLSAAQSGLKTVTVSAYYGANLVAGDTATRVINFDVDTTGPKVVSTSIQVIDGVEHLMVKFDENVKLPTSYSSTISFTKVKDYITSTVTVTPVLTATTTANEVRVQLHGITTSVTKVDTIKINLSNLDKANYKFTLPTGFVQDFFDNNSSEYKDISFARLSDVTTSKPELKTVTIDTVEYAGVQPVDTRKVIVHFNKKLDPVSALSVSNYYIEGVTIASSALLQNDVDHARVELTLAWESNTLSGSRVFTVSNVKSDAGISMDSKTVTVALTENVRPTITKAELVTPTSIKVTFSEDVYSLGAATDFELFIDGTKVSSAVLTTTEVIKTAAGKSLTLVVSVYELTPSDLAKVITIKAKDTTVVKDKNDNPLTAPNAVVVLQ